MDGNIFTLQNMNNYTIKKSNELSDAEIKIILDNWEVAEWKEMKVDEFRQRFEHSEFHLLTDFESNMLSIARINFKFKVKVDEAIYPIAELVGFVAIEILKGYGKNLLGNIKENLVSRKIEAIGFCRNKNSAFYESSGFKVFYDKVKFLRERKDDQWFTPTEDDDIINLTLEENTIQLFENLNHKNPAYLIFE
jgi:hypothetical protein